MAVMSFPLLARSARTAFEEADPAASGLARTLGCGPLAAFRRVTLARRGLPAGVLCCVLARARRVRRDGHDRGQHPGAHVTLALRSSTTTSWGRTTALVLAGVTTALASWPSDSRVVHARRRSRRIAA
jgi:hypothetical protein